MKHLTMISKQPLRAEADQTNLEVLISILTLGFDVVTVFVTAFSAIFTASVTGLQGFLAALTAYSEEKNPEENT
ncbi:MAG: hypothetical protein AMXMBFR84_38350 [Candidatus Hydrogenedentota bacterium]